MFGHVYTSEVLLERCYEDYRQHLNTVCKTALWDLRDDAEKRATDSANFRIHARIFYVNPISTLTNSCQICIIEEVAAAFQRDYVHAICPHYRRSNNKAMKVRPVGP